MGPQGYGSATLNFTFEAAHRQPEVGGKCYNLHGHSFHVGVTLYNAAHIGGVNPQTGLSVEFSMVKGIIRNWLNDAFDHSTLLGCADPLLPALLEQECKVFVFGDIDRVPDLHKVRGWYESIDWPSVEGIAHCIGEQVQHMLWNGVGSYCMVEMVSVSETDTNMYVWNAPNVRPVDPDVDADSKARQVEQFRELLAIVQKEDQTGAEPCV